MSGISAPLRDILTKLNALTVVNQNGLETNLYARIFNNQYRDLREGAIYEFPRPAAFVEIVSPATFEIIGSGFRSADLGIKIHIVHDYYNADGTFAQDLAIYDLRDKIVSVTENGGLSQYCPTACGPMNCVNEYPDYDHDNLVVYICEFITNFTDSKGSKLDPDSGLYDDTQNPDMDLEVVNGGVPEPTPDVNPYIILPVEPIPTPNEYEIVPEEPEVNEQKYVIPNQNK